MLSSPLIWMFLVCTSNLILTALSLKLLSERKNEQPELGSFVNKTNLYWTPVPASHCGRHSVCDGKQGCWLLDVLSEKGSVQTEVRDAVKYDKGSNQEKARGFF